ncbi:hypothetical protein SAMN02927924_03790 [Sphingobium faniae]|jgi:hypothetical protein|nr:hypothetical protein [Alphaproteobacteria bacterium]MBU0793057.1 hypothetical protein [Alphaproteobacteria bacterium]MBU0877665.1 hypothetical protein [Alphaproteobacteria bacterium]MBU1770177.1 hypothetical protein [Alphaproteobacteria bacterium]SCW89471.1 hypothetical protein SAMN02927924_03790 [Sphingobium faniae]|tara:strand:- start:53347 stop:53676 length:330 start_codon:yes stop_codon:yes gene_type:complete
MTRLIAPLLVALALLFSPMSISNGGAVMAQAPACPSAATEAGCPDMDDREKPCTHGGCVSACAPLCLLPDATGQQFYNPAARAVTGPTQVQVGITPEVEARPPQNVPDI